MQNFTHTQAEIREKLAPLLSIYETRTVLGLSSARVFELIRAGKLEAFNPTGEKIPRSEIDESVWGIRVTPSSVQRLLEATRVE